ncbi:30S ribosomal protein S1 [Candidatus Hodgkinia cicadicola]|uniref:30S ribosomal protein S1 n=1 Tax=Candidatus Hodgkinia cicadicola TaxID=573658 RepID=A0ABX4MJ81_9HYPH|nr:30S ribosomal protein S1 [Candidatus Hodgkinia cicadicola]PIM96077.1 30S ribosomal protein S1 [Candidatus Hodgkinia cicadicola]
MVSCIKLTNNICKVELAKNLIKGRVVRGNIIRKNNEFMIIDIGFRSDVRLYKSDIWNYDSFGTNQQIDIRIEEFDSNNGETLVSRRGLGIEESWTMLQQAYNDNLLISGQVIANVIEGYMVKVFGLLALLPLNSTDKDINVQLNRFDRYKIDKIDRENNFITLKQPNNNRKMSIEQNIDTDIMFDKGDLIWGIVNKITDTKIYVDLGWKDGVIDLCGIEWYGMLRLLWNVVIGNLILTKYDGKSEIKDILLLKWCGSGYTGYNVPILGVVLGINNFCFNIKLLKSSNKCVLNSIISIRNTNKLQFETDINYHNVVKLIPSTINILEKKICLNLDLEGTKCFNFVKTNEGRSIWGLISKIKSNSVVVSLPQGLYGELNYSIRSLGNIPSWFKLSCGRRISVRICDYEPVTNKISLALSKIDKNSLIIIEE